MRKIFHLAVILIASYSTAQNNASEVAPILSSTSPNSSKALWDIQLNLNATAAANGSVGMAAVAFHNNEIWVSKWASDSIFRLSNTGTLISKFVVSGVTGTRAITTDGTNLYFSTASNTIYVIDPVGQTMTGTITSAASEASRFLTYDETLDGGNGGFWTGNFNTDIFAISMSGSVLNQIASATHTLTGMYGAGVDNETSGGPYLWVYHQAGTNNCQLTALDLNTGTPSLMIRDVYPDISTTHGLNSGLAGGAFFTNSFEPGTNTVMVLTQSDPVNTIIAYEVESSASVPSQKDAAFVLFPNPASDQVTVQFPKATSNNTTIVILDMKGTVLIEKAIGSGTTSCVMDIQDFSAGTYFVQLNSEDNTQRVKMIK